MAATTKQRLSDMLDADLSKADVQDMMEDDPTASKPSTFSDWLQVASIEDMKASLKSLLDVGNGQALEQMKIVLEEDRAHQDWVENQEKAWKESKDKDEPMLPASKKDVEPLMDAQNVQSQVKYIPLRLTAEERGLLGILEGALYVSEYTDQVDVYHTGSKAKRMALQIQQVCAILAGLVVANNFDVARRPLMERSFADNHYFFRMVFEIGRRYKILNPDKLRGSYGKLIHMLQDSVKGEVERQLDFNCVGSVKTVWSVAKGNPKALAMLQDPLLTIATKEIYTDGKSRAEVALESKDKAEALVELKRKYAEKPPDGAAAPKAAGDLGEALRGGPKRPELEGLLTEERIETIVASISDYFAFLRFNREPVDRMIGFLRHYFNPKDPGKWGLDIYNGRGGSCLSHSHKTQYTFVLQSLLLWREIMGNMFYLWQMTEEDLLDENSTYRLCDTGQGLNRVQHAPRVSRAMHQILHKVQSEVGNTDTERSANDRHMALTTPLTELFKIKHPVMLAGMAGAAGPELAAAVSNAGGLGNIGGVGFTPDGLRKTIKMLKKELVDKNAPFGVDLLLPQVGGNARKTNKDYTAGTLPELVDIIIEEKAALFICAVGVPPKWAVDKFHAAGIPVMNMIGAVKHVEKALESGVDIICAQGGEGGGHTGDTATAILLPKVVDAVRGKMSPLTGKPVQVVGAGGIFDGRGLAACLAMGCSGVWVGTRFIASDEAGAGPFHKQRVLSAGYADTVRTTIYTGRPMRVLTTPYVQDWEQNRTKEMLQLQEQGIPAFVKDVDDISSLTEGGFSVGTLQMAEVLTQEEKNKGVQLSRKQTRERGVYLSGQCAGAIEDIKPAGQIVEEMVQQAAEQLQTANKFLAAKL